MWNELWLAMALVLVIEGLMPALAPQSYRRTMLSVMKMDDNALRSSGVVMIVLGAVTVYFLKG